MADSGLTRSLRLPHATALVVGTIVGASVFVQASEVTEHAPRIWAVLLVWGVSGVVFPLVGPTAFHTAAAPCLPPSTTTTSTPTPTTSTTTPRSPVAPAVVTQPNLAG